MNSKNFRSLCEAYGQVHRPKMIDFEDWVDGLIDEGYDLSDYSWDELYEVFCDENLNEVRGANSPADYLTGKRPYINLNNPEDNNLSPSSGGSSVNQRPTVAPIKAKPTSTSSALSSPANASLSTRMSGANQIYKQQVKSGDIQGAKETGMAAWRMANPSLAKASDARTMTRGTSASTNPQMSGFNRLPTPQQRDSGGFGQSSRDFRALTTANVGQNNDSPTIKPQTPRTPTKSAPTRAGTLQMQNYNYNLHPEVIEDVTSLYQSIYEGKKKVDQDVDGDNDFADVMIARMVASGVPRDEAIRRVRSKEYNLKNEDISEAAPAIAAVAARLAPMLARLGPAAGRMKPLLKRGAKFVAGRGMLDSVMDPNKKEQTPQEKEQENKNQDNGASDVVKKGLTSMYKMGEEYEMVIGYLIDEGYADSLGAAEIILENMSDEWLDEILNNY